MTGRVSQPRATEFVVLECPVPHRPDADKTADAARLVTTVTTAATWCAVAGLASVAHVLFYGGLIPRTRVWSSASTSLIGVLSIMASACHDNPGTVATLPRPDQQLSPGCLNPSTHTR